APEPSLDVLAVHEALERFQGVDATAAQIVKLRYFAGLTIPQVAEALGISTSTADRSWAYARAWLHTALKQGADHGAPEARSPASFRQHRTRNKWSFSSPFGTAGTPERDVPGLNGRGT